MTFGRLGALGRGFGRMGSGGIATNDPLIQISSTSIAEDAADNSVVGTLSINNSPDGVTWTFAITADPDNKFAIANDDELQIDELLDYETATSHLVTIEATPSAGDPISRQFTITVTNVFEAATLNALTLDTDEIEEGSAEDTVVGALQDTTGGSTLSMTDTAGGRFKLSGSNVVAGATATDYDAATSHNITVRETLADSSNSPRDSVIAITVTEAGAFAIGALSGFAWAANPTTDPSPGFDINLPDDAVAGMELVGQYGVSNTEWLRYTLTSDDITADEISVSGGDDIPAGTHSARFRLEDGADFSDWLVVDDIEITASGPDNAIELEGTTDVIELESSTDYIIIEAA